MTYNEQSYLHQGRSMDVTVDWDKQEAEIVASHAASKYLVYKPRDQTSFFRVARNPGLPPNELSGQYTNLQKGIDAVIEYLKNVKETQAVKNERMAVEREERKIAKANSENS